MIAPGTRVRLKPFVETEQPEQYGTVCGNDALYEPPGSVVVVLLDGEYWDPRTDPDDDGLREVPIDQLEVCP